MLSRFAHLFDTPKPIKFTSPLPIVECVKRLQESIGKPMGCRFIPISGKVEQIDENTYKFNLYQDYFGGHKVFGYLTSQSKSSTLIDATHTVDRSIWVAATAFTIITIVLSFSVEVQRNGFARAFWFSIIFIAVIGGIVFASLRSQSLSQLVWYIERTLKQ